MNPPNPEESARIPDLMSEQDLAQLTTSRDHLLASADTWLKARQLEAKDVEPDSFMDFELQQVRARASAAQMAQEIHDYLAIVTGNLEACGSENAARHVRRLAGYATQLEALELAELEALVA